MTHSGVPAVLVILLLAIWTPVLYANEDHVNYRLPITAKPTHYTLRLIPYFEERNFTFDGEVEITVNATKDADSITLHYDEMEIVDTPTIKAVDGSQDLEVLNTNYDNVTDFFRLELDGKLRPGHEYVLHIKYVGTLNDDMVGFYRASYNTSNSVKRWIAVTQFEPTDARKAFPCFDEPALKARFQVNIARTPDYHSISNMPQDNSSEPDSSIGGRIWDSFQETPPMSTYLVAFVVSDLKNISTKDGKYSVWMREEVLSDGKYALSVAPTIVKLMEKYTEIMYELPKLDQVAIPDLFYWAMENWGMVTLWEENIIYKDGESKARRKQNSLLLIAHEFAHLWFGDLVSPKWWNFLWLNEGFATYYEYMISAKVEPDWNLEEQFVPDMHQAALAADSLNSTHPVTADVSDPEEINDIFDEISYDKAASIIRMMEHFLTPETLRKGLSKYLKAHSHGSTEADDLFKALDEQQKEDKILPRGMNVKTIMDTWTLQPGYPVINVGRVNGSIHIAQERFFLKEHNDIDKGLKWWVPISYTKSDEIDFIDTKPKVWLKGQPELQLEDKIQDDEWFMLNLQATGFYRVNYDALTWSLIIKHLTSSYYKDIHVLNRAQLLDDAFSLSRAGKLNYTTALELSTYLAEESDPVPWISYTNTISYIQRHLHGHEAYDNFKSYVLILLNKLYENIGFKFSPEDSHNIKVFQPTVTSWACEMGHKDCVSKSIEMFSEWMKKPEDNLIPPDVKEVVYCTAVRHNKKMWEFLWNQYGQTEDSSDRWELYESLSCTEDEALIKRYLSLALTEDAEDYLLETSVYFILFNSPNGVDIVLNYLSEYMDEISQSFEHEHESTIGNIVSIIASQVTSKEQTVKLRKFLSDNNLNEEAEEDDWIPETMDDDVMWIEKYNDVISNWLQNFLNTHKTSE